MTSTVRLLASGTLLGTCLLVAGLAQSIGLPRATPESVGLSSDRLAVATALLQAHIDAGELAGVVAAVARRGQLVYLEALGVQDIETREPMRPDTVFRIYSMTKALTATAAMRLVERAELRLEEPVSKYLPEFADIGVFENPDDITSRATRAPARELKVKDLLLHTDGLSHRWSPQYRMRRVHSRHATLERVAANVARAPLMEDPGAHWRYGIGPTVLARIVEVVSGRPYDEFLREEVLEPAAMHDTGYSIRPADLERLASLYAVLEQSEGGGIVHQPEDPSLPYTAKPALFDGASNMLSTAPDYLRFAQMLLGGGELDGRRILSRKSVERMMTNHLDDDVLPMVIQDTTFDGMGWGFGMGVATDFRKVPATVSNGEVTWGGAAGTRFWADPTEALAVVLMVQIFPHYAYELGDRFRTAVQHAIVD